TFHKNHYGNNRADTTCYIILLGHICSKLSHHFRTNGWLGRRWGCPRGILIPYQRMVWQWSPVVLDTRGTDLRRYVNDSGRIWRWVYRDHKNIRSASSWTSIDTANQRGNPIVRGFG